MLDRYVVPAIKPALRGLATKIGQTKLVGRPVRADDITVAGFVIGLLCVLCLWLEWYFVAFLLLLLNRLADGVDGELARLYGASQAGGFLDITLDFIFYALFPIGFALADPQHNALPAALLIASFVGTGASFLAFSQNAEKLGLQHPDFAYKGFYYLDGLAEGTETVLFFMLMCLLPQYFVPLALLFAGVCVITAINRVANGYLTIRKAEKERPLDE